jgi:hypothetical protein
MAGTTMCVIRSCFEAEGDRGNIDCEHIRWRSLGNTTLVLRKWRPRDRTGWRLPTTKKKLSTPEQGEWQRTGLCGKLMQKQKVIRKILMFLDIIHCLFYSKHNVSESRFCLVFRWNLFSWAQSIELVPISGQQHQHKIHTSSTA